MNIKDFLIIILSSITIALLFFIFSGSFCSCSKIYCPSNSLHIRSYFV